MKVELTVQEKNIMPVMQLLVNGGVPFFYNGQTKIQTETHYTRWGDHISTVVLRLPGWMPGVDQMLFNEEGW